MAREKGYTEPDPRDDLNGLDVARKLLILARETGLKLELKDIRVESLVSAKCLKASGIDKFFLALEEEDGYFEKKRLDAEGQGKKLRYIAILKNGKAEIVLKAVDMKHPFYSLSGSDNMISFTTERYHERPLVIKGPGAGAEVTAAGVFADIIRIANYAD
jgi:aspartokinase/homoserine dehydrogenase 1